MADFLSDEWIAQLDARLRSATLPTELRNDRGPIPEQYVIGVVVTDTQPGDETRNEPRDDRSRSWHVIIDAQGARVARGCPDSANLVLTVDAATAAELSTGTLNAQRAIDHGGMTVRGDINRLGALAANLLVTDRRADG